MPKATSSMKGKGRAVKRHSHHLDALHTEGEGADCVKKRRQSVAFCSTSMESHGLSKDKEEEISGGNFSLT